MDSGVSSGVGNFKVEHGPDASVLVNVHEAGLQEVGDVDKKSNIKIADRGIGG